MIIADKEYILDFLSGDSEDHQSRIYSEMLEWSDIQLEECHDQIQWIFPLHEPSRKATTYPVLNEETVEAGRKNPKIIKNLRAAKDRFENFYGIGQYENFAKQDRWCRDGNHNLLRITRIIRSLRLFDLEIEAQEFYDYAVEVANRCSINQNTLNYWNKAWEDNVWDSLQQ